MLIALLMVAAEAVAPLRLSLKSGEKSELVDAAAMAALPHVSVAVQDHGRTRTYSGVALPILTGKLGAPSGDALRGAALTSVVIATASDGYRVALSLAETDPGMRRDRVIVADAEDGRPLAANDGPLKLVVEGDLRPARAARHLVSLEVKAQP